MDIFYPIVSYIFWQVISMAVHIVYLDIFAAKGPMKNLSTRFEVSQNLPQNFGSETSKCVDNFFIGPLAAKISE
jgi:hypothetical protein